MAADRLHLGGTPHSLARAIRMVLERATFASGSAFCAALALSPLAQGQDAPGNASDGSEVETEIVVTGRRAALENATERKRASESIIDSVVADEAGMLPDNSITEVLQRVSGVTVVRFASLGDPDHFSAEGSGVQVRGLSGVAGRLNGREVFSASGGRGLSWGDVTPELMQAVDVYKTATANLIEGGTGGQIDLRTKMPFDLKDDFTLNASANINYGDLSKQYKPGASVLLSDTWDVGNGRFGVLLDVAYNEYASNADFFRMEPFYRTRVGDQDRFIPGGYDFGNDSFERERQGVYLGVQWAPTESFTLSQTVFYSKYDEERSGNGIFATSQTLAVDPATSTFDDDGFLVTSDNVYQRNTTNFQPSGAVILAGGATGVAITQSITRDISTEFVWTASERLGVKGALQWVDSSWDRWSYDMFPQVRFPTSFGIDLTGDFPHVRLPSGPNDLANPAVSTWNAVMDNLQDNQGDMFAANLDFDFSLSEEAFFRSVGFGARYADRTEVDTNAGYNWTALCAGWNGCPVRSLATARPGDTELVAWDDFFRGDIDLPGAVVMPSMTAVSRFDPYGDHALYGGTPGDAFRFIPTDTTESTTTNTAVYALIRFDGGERRLFGMSYGGNVGLRAVRIENTSEGFFRPSGSTFARDGVLTQIGSTAYPLSGGTETTRVLPSVNLTFSPADTMKLRLAYNVTMDQPSFNALRANGTAGVNTVTYNPAIHPVPVPPATTNTGVFNYFTVDSGNPRLKPVISHNSDVSFEWYQSRALSAHVSLFHKSIDNWLTYGQQTEPYAIEFVLPTPQTVIEPAQVTNVKNATKAARVQGFEVGGRVFFDELPGIWSGFGLEANYTLVDSKNPGDQYFDIDGIARDDAPVQGLSKHNYNLTGMYERGPISVRLAWSWRSKYLQSTNSNGTNGSYRYYPVAGPQAVSVFKDIALPVYGGSYGQLDFGTTWRPSEKLSMSVELSNLTNEITHTLQGGYAGGAQNIRSWYVADRRANVSVRVNF
jgi:iron complex outermembrane recepter protein